MLQVSQGAVTRALQRLEQHLGYAVLARHSRGAVLNPAGQSYFEKVAPALDTLEEAAVQAQGSDEPFRLRLSVIPTLASHWLIPRLPDFHERHPEVRLEFTAFQREADFSKIDATILSTDGSVPEDISANYIVGKEIVPVCKPGLMRGPVKDPRELQQYPLLFNTAQPDVWGVWFQGAGVSVAQPKLHQGFDQASQMMEAAAAGLGIAVVQKCLVEAYLANGRLAIPFERTVMNRRGYHLVYPSRKRLLRPLALFKAWLMEQAEGD
jgi:LysR family transcriptional regulator, glycine cleavage system transcriptional activator